MEHDLLNTEKKNNPSSGTIITIALVVLLVFVIELLIGKYIWNNVLIKVIPSIGPVNLIELFLLIILFNILLGGSYGMCRINTCKNFAYM